MDICRSVNVVDTHTECDLCRLVIGGIPPIPGKTMMEKRNYFSEHLDDIRKFVIQEPRGHRDMFGAVLTAPVEEGSDFGIFFIDASGFMDLCGHGIMAAANVSTSLGFIAQKGKENLFIDTTAGKVQAKINFREGRVKDVTVKSVPSFLYQKDVPVKTSAGTLSADVSFSGNFFAFLRAPQAGIALNPGNIPAFVKLGMEVKNELNRNVRIAHPELPHIDKVEIIEFFDEPNHPEARERNVLIYGEGLVGRDPCGTGTCAKMATEVARGKLKLNEEYVGEGILGTIYRGRAVEKAKVGNFDAIVPEITGRTFIVGFCNFVLDRTDPMPTGWFL